MSGFIDEYELEGLRRDFSESLGIHEQVGGSDPLAEAKTLGRIVRLVNEGTLNETTLEYEDQVWATIYTGALTFSPVTYRRDRQELGGQEAIRIRQYRAVLPWDSGDVHIDDVLILDRCSDPEVVGRGFDVTDVMYESELTARRITLTDTSKDVSALC